MHSETIQTTCCVVGGGPAGMMLGLLLARAGIEVHVLEKHADFFRDFRGDTVHPSTLENMHELGFLDEFLKLPHQEYRQINVNYGGKVIDGPNFGVLHTHCKFVAFMPQWDVLSFLAARAKEFPSFHLHMNWEANALIEEGGKVVGVRAKTPDGEAEVRADLVVGADGRSSILREQSGLEVEDLGAPIDVLWLRLPRTDHDPPETLGNVVPGKAMVMINRGDYYQCGLIIPKGGITALKEKGMDAVRADIVDAAPFTKDRVDTLQSWDDIKLLNVQLNRLKKWYRPGLLFIGDAAHAMSPAGGVGINLAIQDAVATANILQDDLKGKTLSEQRLKRVQDRREDPTRKMQDIQQRIHEVLITTLGGKPSLPWYLMLALKTHAPQYVMAHVIGLGFRPEHVRQAELVRQ
jgi:2-polyprenyl-6-methoxyphenol hydroxylase-like FAD-dependent oxidoreductase